MLTRNDKTVEDARDHISTALKAGVKHIGFKDVGVSFDTLNLLFFNCRPHQINQSFVTSSYQDYRNIVCVLCFYTPYFLINR